MISKCPEKLTIPKSIFKINSNSSKILMEGRKLFYSPYFKTCFNSSTICITDWEKNIKFYLKQSKLLGSLLQKNRIGYSKALMIMFQLVNICCWQSSHTMFSKFHEILSYMKFKYPWKREPSIWLRMQICENIMCLR